MSSHTIPARLYIDYCPSFSPLVPGHEIVGRIAAVGPGVEHWKDGDRVGAGWHGGHDGNCKACKKGMFQMCDNRQVHGETKNGGCKLKALPHL